MAAEGFEVLFVLFVEFAHASIQIFDQLLRVYKSYLALAQIATSKSGLHAEKVSKGPHPLVLAAYSGMFPLQSGSGAPMLDP